MPLSYNYNLYINKVLFSILYIITKNIQFINKILWGFGVLGCSARSLHSSLRPTIRDADGTTLLILGIASAVGEELFFRGLLVPALGLVVSSLAFGLLHQVKGRARWVWAGWAAIMGVLFGALFLATGSLVGPIVAHAAINVTNLKFLRDTDFEPPKTRRLGGLLQRT